MLAEEAIFRISADLDIELDRFVKILPEPEKFTECCDAFVNEIDAAGKPIEPLPFCLFLRAQGFKREAQTICQFLINTRPGALTRTLAA